MRSNRLPRRLAVVAAGLAIALVGAGSAEAAAKSSQSGDLRADGRVAIALTDQNQLVSFKVRKPDQLLSVRTVRGLLPGVSLVGIDYRPRTGDLYGVGSDSVVYRVNPQTGIAIAENLAGTPPAPVAFTPGLMGDNFGVDFNPAPDAIRIVSDAGQNKRVAPDAGTTLGDDLALNPGMPKVGGAAYTNSSFSVTQPAATAVQLYVVDYQNDMVFLQNPPNNGTLTNGQKLAGVDVQPKFGWDIAGTGDVGYLATGDRRGRSASLYTVDETTGFTRNLGEIGGRRLRGLTVTGLAVSQDQP